VDSVFFLLKETNRNIFQDPSADMIEDYVYESKDAVVVKPFSMRFSIALYRIKDLQ